jgi:integrase
VSQFQTPDGRFGFRIRDEFGVRISRVVGSKEAAAYAEKLKRLEVKNARDRAKELTGSRLTVSDALDIYLSAAPRRTSTKKTQPAMLVNFRQTIGQIPLQAVTPATLAAYFEVRATQVATSTLALEMRLVRATFRLAKETGASASNPTLEIKPGSTYSTKARALTRNEELRLVNAASPVTLPRVLLWLDTGMRVSETISARVGHIVMPDRAIRVFQSKPVYRTRCLPLTGRLAAVLEEILQPLAPQDPFIPQGRPANFLPLLAARLGFTFTAHDLRHTFAKRLLECGAPTEVISAALGHSPRSATDLYTRKHVNMDDLRIWFARMELLALKHAEGELTPADLYAPPRNQ